MNDTITQGKETIPEDFSHEIYNVLGQIGDYISAQGRILIHPSVQLLDSDYFLYWCEIYWTVNNNEQLALEFYDEYMRITSLTDDEFITEFIEYICPCVDCATCLHNHIYSA